MTRYISTRGEAPVLGFCDVMLTGLARDGGLYVPETWPQLSPDTIADFFGRPYWEVAVDVVRPFVGGGRLLDLLFEGRSDFVVDAVRNAASA